jgi:uncharacterized BrkB/YihY/UPF0761 family membrane protein
MLQFRFGPRFRHPLARLLGGLLGIVAVVGVLLLGFFAFLVVLIGGAIWILINHLRKPKAQKSARPAAPKRDSQGIIDGEFTVVRTSSSQSPVSR